MNKYEEITSAREILELNEQETLINIKKQYKKLLKKYHPDVCEKDKNECREKTEKIIKAYKTITEYCDNYQYSFKKEEVEKYFSVEEFWRERFGNDPMWSNKSDNKN